MGLFVFTSRSRHTRLVSDWSSDVCSSDLATALGPPRKGSPRSTEDPQEVLPQDLPDVVVAVAAGPQGRHDKRQRRHVRSEERRVGKERSSERAQCDDTITLVPLTSAT